MKDKLYYEHKEAFNNRRKQIRVTRNSIKIYEKKIESVLGTDPTKLPEYLRSLQSLKSKLHDLIHNKNQSSAYAYYPSKPNRKSRRQRVSLEPTNITPKKKKRK